LSHPAAARRPDDTAPSQRAAKGFVCPQCQRRFDENAGRSQCPDDGSPLVRVSDMAAADGDPMLGRVLAGRFTILARLGAGSMGTVYRAKQAPIGREVAIKILRSDRAVDEVSRARFLREARANSLLTSPNTVTVFDFGQSENGDFYLAMELLEGESLGQRIKRVGRIDVGEALETAKQALTSLSEAHAKGIIHRDLKPDNLFYARTHAPNEQGEQTQEVVKVLDFGIAKLLHTDGELAMNAVETQAGTVFGTPRYMSPEQAQGKPLDARSDLYSLGVILYHMITGRPPFTDDDAIVVMARHIKTMPRPLAEVAPDARIPAEVEALVMRVLSKDPDKRPDNAEALIAELSRVRESAVVTSGVRASLAGPVEKVLEVPAAPAPIPQPTHAAFSNDTLSSLAGVPSKTRRWMAPAIVIAFLAVAAVAAVLYVSASRRAAEAAANAPPVATTVPPPSALVPPLPLPASATAQIPAPTSTTRRTAAPPRPAATTTPPPSDPTPPPPTTPGVRPPHRGGRGAAGGGGGGGSHPATAPSVGYGYLE
jgi:serine/threonine-protein kinase